VKLEGKIKSSRSAARLRVMGELKGGAKPPQSMAGSAHMRLLLFRLEGLRPIVQWRRQAAAVQGRAPPTCSASYLCDSKVCVGLCEGGVEPPHSKAGSARKMSRMHKRGLSAPLVDLLTPVLIEMLLEK